jgi:non-structural maintenance of chromosomes element 4
MKRSSASTDTLTPIKTQKSGGTSKERVALSSESSRVSRSTIASQHLLTNSSERRDDFLRDTGDGLTHTVRAANKIYAEVKQTNDATLDSRLLVNVSDLASKKTAQLVLGDSSTGIDVEEFIGKCITFMRNGGPLDRGEEDVAPSSTRRRRARNRDDDEEDEDDPVGEVLDWEVLGRHACVPHNSRPSVPSFLLGPLSVEKKQRTQTQRRARQLKEAGGRETRPENLSREDLSQSEENALTAICTRIRNHLANHIAEAEEQLTQRGIKSIEELHTPRGRKILRDVRLTDTGGVGLFDYVINPRSFGQTVENLFYVSFLVKEGSIGFYKDSEGLPTIAITEQKTLEQQRASKTVKHQAVMAIDYSLWRELTEAFDIKEPLIPHRSEETQAHVGQRGWYT